LRKASGRILWIMTPALIPTPYVTSIHACDFAANCLVRTLDIELSPWRIPVVQIRCGGIKTPNSLKATPLSEALRRHPRFDLYRQKLEQWAKEMTEFDQKRTEPLKVAQAVEAALGPSHPRRSYSVGHMASAAAFLEALPQPLADAILKMRF
jgi:NAD(P)-dependent dehydrogenase (short-subunit alcohol dehydrogenase family)